MTGGLRVYCLFLVYFYLFRMLKKKNLQNLLGTNKMVSYNLIPTVDDKLVLSSSLSWAGPKVQCRPFIAHLVLTQIWI